MSCLLADYEIKPKFYIQRTDIKCPSIVYLRAHSILCCFLSPCHKIRTEGQESTHLTWNESSVGTGPTFMSFTKYSEDWGFIRTWFRNTLEFQSTLTSRSLKSSRCFSQAIHMYWSMSSMQGKLLLFVQIEVKQRKNT